MKTLAFFGGTGKTTLVYHLVWMFQELGVRTLALDLDPKANLTGTFFEDDKIEDLWEQGDGAETILGALRPLLDRLGDIQEPVVEEIAPNLGLLPGSPGLTLFEDRLTDAWPRCLDDNLAEAGDAFRVTTAFYRIAVRAAERRSATLVLIDVGPSLGSLTRAALVASDYVATPLGADLYSLQGLRHLGAVLESWRLGWATRLEKETYPPNLSRPAGGMQPIGYMVLRQTLRAGRPVEAYRRWADRLPGYYHREVLKETVQPPTPDPYQLAALRHYQGLMALAQDARKPMFLLTPSDGAIGGYAAAVKECWEDFRLLAHRIAKAVGVEIPGPR